MNNGQMDRGNENPTQHLPWWLRKTTQKAQSGWSAPGFEPGTSRMRVSCVTTEPPRSVTLFCFSCFCVNCYSVFILAVEFAWFIWFHQIVAVLVILTEVKRFVDVSEDSEMDLEWRAGCASHNVQFNRTVVAMAWPVESLHSNPAGSVCVLTCVVSGSGPDILLTIDLWWPTFV